MPPAAVADATILPMRIAQVSAAQQTALGKVADHHRQVVRSKQQLAAPTEAVAAVAAAIQVDQNILVQAALALLLLDTDTNFGK
jgi:hypothetical protein